MYHFLSVLEWFRSSRGRVGDSTTLVNSLGPQMSELVEDAVASCCGNTVGHFLLIWNELQKLVELKLKNFSFNIFNVSQIFWQTSCTTETQIQLLHFFLKGLCWVSVCWILINALFHVLGVFWFYFVPHCSINIWHHMLCYLPDIYNYITFTASLEREQFEFVQSFPVV